MTSSSSSSPEISAALPVDTHDQFSYKHATHDEVLEDLSSRFILNLPDEELASLERICFQVEQAHWFYEDFIREENPKFPSLPLKKFSAMLFHACPVLHHWSHDHEQAFNTFMQYKTRVPVCGAIMLNDTWEKCLLVKGWKASSGWGFPKGKINEFEPEINCAIREVLEETGYNLAGEIDPENVIEMSIKEQKISLYIVPGVPEDYPFKTKTRKEISKIEWFKLTDLPTWKRSKASLGKFYLISPFIGALKTFVNERKPRSVPRKGPKTRNGQPGQRKEDAKASSALKPYATDHDHTQESSSQSSSADNGDPQTPSPRYLESVPNNVVDRPSITEDNASKDMAMEAFDPHFARLLTCLSLSASAMNDKDKPIPPSLSITTRESSPPEPTTPIPTSAITSSSANSHSVSESENQVDWSSSAPTRLVNGLNGPVAPLSASSTRSSAELDSLQSRPQASFQPSTPSLSHRTNDAQARLGYPPDRTFSHTASHASISSTASSSMSPTRGKMSRRSSSTTDISPYLSRPVEVPTSGKRLKQLALLESVADESAKMTPMLGRQGNAYSFGERRSHVPVPENNVTIPPLGVHFTNVNDPRVIYSSGAGAGYASALPTSQPYNAPMSMHDDVFRVRPYMNHAYNVNMNTSHSTGALNGGRVTGPNVAGVYPPRSHIQGHYRPVVGSPMMPSSMQPPPHPAFAAMSPGFEMPLGNNAKLLSILNGNNAAGPATLVFPPPLNGNIGHR